MGLFILDNKWTPLAQKLNKYGTITIIVTLLPSSSNLIEREQIL